MTEDRAPICSECTGTTIMLRGSGLDTQFKVCSRRKEPGHLTEDEIRERLASIRQRLNPSGRTA